MDLLESIYLPIYLSIYMIYRYSFHMSIIYLSMYIFMFFSLIFFYKENVVNWKGNGHRHWQGEGNMRQVLMCCYSYMESQRL